MIQSKFTATGRLRLFRTLGHILGGGARPKFSLPDSGLEVWGGAGLRLGALASKHRGSKMNSGSSAGVVYGRLQMRGRCALCGS